MRRINSFPFFALMAIYFISVTIVSCNRNNIGSTQMNVGTDSTTVVMPQVINSQAPIQAPDAKKDLSMLIAMFIGVYEVIVRLVKTKSNLSIIDILTVLINSIIPNRRL